MPELVVPPEVQAMIASQFAGQIGGELRAIDAAAADHNSKKHLRGLNLDKAAIIRSTGLQMPGDGPQTHQSSNFQPTLTAEQTAELERQSYAEAGLNTVNPTYQASHQSRPQMPMAATGFPIQNSQVLQLLSTNEALTLTLQAMNVLLLDIQSQVKHLRKQTATTKPK